MRNARCVATGDPPFLINSSIIKAQCSSNHTMVYIENGTYTAVRRRALYHFIRCPPEAMTHPNRGVLSAASCISIRIGFINSNNFLRESKLLHWALSATALALGTNERVVYEI